MQEEFPTQLSRRSRSALSAATQARENVVRALEAEFGLLTSTEVAMRMGARTASAPSASSDLRESDRVLSIRHGDGYRFPGFQFDARSRIKPLISPFIAIARERGWSIEDATLWMLSSTRYLHGDRPVDRIDDVGAVLEAAWEAWGIEW